MALKVFSSNDLPRDEWLSLTGNSFFSSPQCASIWQAKDGRALFLIECDNSIFTAGIAGVVFGNNFFQRYESMPNGLYGGPYFVKEYSEIQKEQFIISLEKYFKSQKLLRVVINKPFHEFNLKSFRRLETSTHIISLEGSSYQPPRPEVSRHIRSAEKRGAQVDIFSREDELDRFYQLVLMTDKRHNRKTNLPSGLFKNLFYLSQEDHRILWLKATYENKLIGSQIYFIEHLQLFYWQFYSDDEYSYFKPGYLMTDYAIDYAIKNNLKSVNLGGTPPEADSLIFYKERWGGRKIDYSCYTYYNKLGKFLSWLGW